MWRIYRRERSDRIHDRSFGSREIRAGAFGQPEPLGAGHAQGYQALALDARRAVGEIERVARNLNRDPKGFLFGSGGGSNIPAYSGR